MGDDFLMKCRFWGLIICFILIAGCGRNVSQDKNRETYYSVEEILFSEPSIDTEKPVMATEEIEFILANGSLYKLDRVMQEDDYSTSWYLHTLSSPYEEWNTTEVDISKVFAQIRTDSKEYYIIGAGGLTKQGDVYLNYGELDSDAISTVVLKSGEWLPLVDLDEEITDGLGYSADVKGLYRTKDDDTKELLKWKSYGYSFYEDPMIHVESENNIFVFEKTIHGNRFLHVQAIEGTDLEKQQIYLAAYPSAYLNSVVNDYNRQSDCYEVVIENYLGDFSTMNDRLRTEIMTGKGPDIIDSMYIDLYSYGKKGYLVPVDEIINDKGILRQIADSGKVEGKYYVVPLSFSIQTLISTKDIVGDRDGWNIDEMMSVIKEHPVEALYMGADAYGVLSCLLCYDEDNSSFIDWNNNTCTLDIQEFISLLECAKEWKDYQSDAATIDMGEEIRNGHVMVIRSVGGTGGRLEDYYSYLNMLGNSCTYIGYPVNNGNGSFVECYGFSINSSSKNKEAAKDFLEYLVSEEIQLKKWEQDGSLPVTESLLEKVLFKYAKEIKHDDDLKSSSEKRAYNEEEVRKFYEIIKNSKPMGSRYAEIEDIIYEEAATYFEGDDNPWNVARKIQNRIQLFLTEHS